MLMTLPPTVVQCRGMMDCGEDDDKRLQARKEKSEEKKKVLLCLCWSVVSYVGMDNYFFKCNIDPVSCLSLFFVSIWALTGIPASRLADG